VPFTIPIRFAAVRRFATPSKRLRSSFYVVPLSSPPTVPTSSSGAATEQAAHPSAARAGGRRVERLLRACGRRRTAAV